MIKSCDRTQRKFAIFLLVVIVTEVYFITRIVEHEHHTAHAEQGGLLKRVAPDRNDTNSSSMSLKNGVTKRKSSLLSVSIEKMY